MQYMEMHKRSMDDPAGFWSDIASEFYWKQKWGDQVFSENLDVRKGPISIEVDIFSSFSFFLIFLCSIFCISFQKLVRRDDMSEFMFDQWFKGGITNICYNCLDKNVEAGLGDKTAIYWEGNELGVDASLTYSELLQQVCQV